MAQTVEDLLIGLGFQVDESSRSNAMSQINNLKSMATKALGALGISFAIFQSKQFADECRQLASDAEQMEGKFEAVFGSMSDTYKQFAEDYANTVGRSKTKIMQYLADTQNMVAGFMITDITNKEQTEKERAAAAELTEGIMELSMNLAAFANINEDMALESTTRAVMGQAQAAKTLGAVLNEETKATAMERHAQDLLAKGIDVTKEKYKDMAQWKKNWINYYAIVDQSPDAMFMEDEETGQRVGAAMAERNSFESLSRRNKAMQEEMKITIGHFLLPFQRRSLAFGGSMMQYVTKFVKKLGDVNDENSKAAKIAEAYNNFFNIIETAVTSISSSIEGIVDNLGIVDAVAAAAVFINNIITNRIAPVISLIGLLFAQLATGFREFFTDNKTDNWLFVLLQNAGIDAAKVRSTLLQIKILIDTIANAVGKVLSGEIGFGDFFGQIEKDLEGFRFDILRKRLDDLKQQISAAMPPWLKNILVFFGAILGAGALMGVQRLVTRISSGIVGIVTMLSKIRGLSGGGIIGLLGRAGIIYGLIKVVKDLFNFLEGKESVIGKIFDHFGVNSEVVRKKINDIRNILSQLFDGKITVSDALSRIFGEEKANKIINAANKIRNGVKTIKQAFRDLRQAFDPVVKLFNGGETVSLGSVLNAIGESLQNVGGLIVNAITNWYNALPDDTKAKIQPILDFGDKIIKAANKIKDGFETIKKAFSDLRTAFDPVLKLFNGEEVLTLESVLNAVGESLQNVGGLIGDAINNWYDALPEDTKAKIQPILDFGNQIIEFANSLISGIDVDAVVGTVTDLVTGITEAITGLFSGEGLGNLDGSWLTTLGSFGAVFGGKALLAKGASGAASGAAFAGSVLGDLAKGAASLVNPLNILLLLLADIASFNFGGPSILGTIIDQTGGDAEGLRTQISETFNDIKESCSGLWEEIEKLGANLKKFWDENGGTISEIVSAIAGGVFGVLESAVLGLSGAISPAVDAIKDLIAILNDLLTGDWESLGGDALQFFKDLGGIFEGLGEKFSKAFEDIFGKNPLDAWNDALLGFASQSKYHKMAIDKLVGQEGWVDAMLAQREAEANAETKIEDTRAVRQKTYGEGNGRIEHPASVDPSTLGKPKSEIVDPSTLGRPQTDSSAAVQASSNQYEDAVLRRMKADQDAAKTAKTANDTASKAASDTASAVSSSAAEGASSVKAETEGLLAFLAEKTQEFLFWGGEAGQLYALGFSNSVSDIEGAAALAAQAEAAYLHQSTPDKGPLRGNDKWGTEFGDLYAQGLRSRFGVIRDAVTSMAGILAGDNAQALVSAGTANPMMMGSTGGVNVTQYISFNNSFTGTDRQNQAEASRQMSSNAKDATSYMANAIAYGR